jgi:polyhydroxyalkanoate synthesis regulator protein
LTQIIAENAKGSDSTFPIDMLRQMVIATGKATQENTLKYMQAVLDMYQNAFRAMSPAGNPFDAARIDMPPRPAAPRQPVRATRKSPQKKNASEVEELKQRVRDLETLVSNLAARKKKTKTGGRRAGR